MNQPTLKQVRRAEQVDLGGRHFEDGLRRSIETFAHAMGKLRWPIRLRQEDRIVLAEILSDDF